MLYAVHPKLPSRNIEITKKFFTEKMGFLQLGANYPEYLMVKKDQIEIHFFKCKDLNPLENYGQIYIRTHDIDNLYQSLINQEIEIHPNGKLQVKPWNQKEFSILDPDHNLITFGENIE